MDSYKVYFDVKGLETSLFKTVDGLETTMRHEFVRAYNEYAVKCNGEVTDKLNDKFNHLYPNYFNDNRNKEWYELTDYNQFMADGYQRMVVDELNNGDFSPLLDFYVDPEEVVFTGRLKVDPNVTISIYLKAH